ncbi:hypothetical protein N0V82_007746 [Gnomoniopsis sp. IMI 355080]|nr:hypothetical protein N0V82_007746 [Gnomoniopsis sp. IMI 355080]
MSGYAPDQVTISLPNKTPQDPFLPVEIPNGPAFLDTEACLCAYRHTPVTTSDEATWECIGDQTDRVTVTNQGKWFRTIHNETIVTTGLPIWDASNGPDVDDPLMYDAGRDALVPFESDNMTVYNGACTGQNQTTFSTAFYRAVNEIEADLTPVDAMPCWRGPSAVPMQIMGLDEWTQSGCNEGFLCENNTVNSLPQYCPPIEKCSSGRAAGFVCQSQHLNIGMGPFEPVVCQSGYYCPDGGTEKIVCPAGHYCQVGAAQPTACSVGSVCPAGSKSQASYIPLVVLCILDLCLLLGMLLLPLRRRMKRQSAHTSISKLPLQPNVAGTVTPTSSTVSGSTIDVEAMSNEDFRTDDELAPHLQSFIESMRRATETAHFGLSFQYKNLSYHPQGALKAILHNVTGSIERGNLTAVMGGSGAGKSTFINVLMGKLTNTSGSVMVNHVPVTMDSYKKLIGYVPQDDIVLPDLSIRENIMHSARVRLPRNWSDAEIQSHTDAVISCLELAHVQDSLVGTVGKPFISGGQRKRVSIGMELAAAPMAIFLDEPTSGLDATAASSIIRTLRSVARLGISVVVTIHQPRAEIMAMVDELILLADGQVVCHGPESFVQAHFYKLGFGVPLPANSGDVITDIITGNGRSYKATGDVSVDWLVANSACSRMYAEDRAPPTSHTNPTSRRSKLWLLPPTPLQLIRKAGPQQSLHDPAILETLRQRGASRLKQTWLCLRRAMLQQWRYKSSFASEMLLACVPALLLGLSVQSRNGMIFRGLYRGGFSILSPAIDVASAPQLSMLTGVAVGLISSAPGVRVFSEEILMQRREAEAGHSQAAYFVAKVLATLPRMLCACLHFSVILLLLGRLIVPWGVAFAANLCYFWCIYGVAALISMLSRREDAPLLATMVSLILGILCGAAPNLAQVAEWKLVWLWRMSPGVWLTELYFGELVRPSGYLYQTELAAEAMGLDLNSTARNLGVLLALGVAYRLMAYVGLLYARRLRI